MSWMKLGPALGGLQLQAGQLGAQLLSATGDMTARNVAVTIIRKGKEVLEGIVHRAPKKPKVGRPEKPLCREEPLGHHQNVQNQTQHLLRSSWLKYLNQAQKQNLAKELQDAAIRNLQTGSAALFGRAVGLGRRRIPLYALLGFTLGTGSVNVSSHDEEFAYDRVCEDIKTMFQTGKQDQWSAQHGSNLESYEFGQLIAKGCNAAVYEARLRNDANEPCEQEACLRRNEEEESIEVIHEDTEDQSSASSEGSFDIVEDVELTSFSTGSDITIITETDTTSINQDPPSDVAAPQMDSNFDLAVKMMFNYDAESQSEAIFRSMKNETVPAKMADSFGQMMEWENGNHPKKKRLKPHPNVVDMWAVFVDDIQPFPKCLSEFPHALPSRLNPDGFGRNKTMYLVMKRYNCTLRDYLHQQRPTLQESLLLLTQLVEAIVHLGQASVAHRDIKSDNILLDTDHVVPHLVLSDFGSCLAEDRFGNLKVPYFTEDTCKGGNRSLMAPEVVCATSGYRMYLDYSQSDIWACGAVAYEIFGASNPFYRSKTQQHLDSSTYREEDLPDLPDDVPDVLQHLIKAMLHRDPAQRPNAVTVANILHLLLWGPPEWTMALTSGGHPPCKVKVMRWLLTLSAGALCQRAMQRSTFIAADNPVEMQLKSTFLLRLNLSDIISAVEFAWSLHI